MQRPKNMMISSDTGPDIKGRLTVLCLGDRRIEVTREAQRHWYVSTGGHTYEFFDINLVDAFVNGLVAMDVSDAISFGLARIGSISRQHERAAKTEE